MVPTRWISPSLLEDSQATEGLEPLELAPAETEAEAEGEADAETEAAKMAATPMSNRNSSEIDRMGRHAEQDGHTMVNGDGDDGSDCDGASRKRKAMPIAQPLSHRTLRRRDSKSLDPEMQPASGAVPEQQRGSARQGDGPKLCRQVMEHEGGRMWCHKPAWHGGCHDDPTGSGGGSGQSGTRTLRRRESASPTLQVHTEAQPVPAIRKDDEMAEEARDVNLRPLRWIGHSLDLGKNSEERKTWSEERKGKVCIASRSRRERTPVDYTSNHVSYEMRSEVEAVQPAPRHVGLVAGQAGWRLHLSAANVIGYKGVSALPDGEFKANARQQGSYLDLGIFSTAVEAAVAYARAIGDPKQKENSRWASIEVSEAELVAAHPRFEDLVGADVCVMHAAYSDFSLTRSDAIGWRGEVTDSKAATWDHNNAPFSGATTQVKVFGSWVRLMADSRIRPIRQSASSEAVHGVAEHASTRTSANDEAPPPPPPSNCVIGTRVTHRAHGMGEIVATKQAS